MTESRPICLTHNIEMILCEYSDAGYYIAKCPLCNNEFWVQRIICPHCMSIMYVGTYEYMKEMMASVCSNPNCENYILDFDDKTKNFNILWNGVIFLNYVHSFNVFNCNLNIHKDIKHYLVDNILKKHNIESTR